MMDFTARTARQFLVIKAAKRWRGEMEKAGLENLKILAEKGVSIFGTYLQGCSPREQATLRRDFNGLLAMGVTPDMVLDEVAGQIPEVGVIMKGKEGYKKAEIQKIYEFVR